MYARVTLASLIGGLALALAAGAAQPDRYADLRAAPETIVQVEPGRSAEAAPLLRRAGGVRFSAALGMWKLPRDRARRLLPELERRHLVRLWAPNVRLFPLEDEPGDPLVPQQWWLAAIGAAGLAPPGPGVPVAVVDRGLDVTHPEFAGRPDTVLVNRQFFAHEENGHHATSVSSIVGAPANGVGVVGLYPQARLRSYDASPDGTLHTIHLLRGIDEATRRGPAVVNLSLGFPSGVFLRTEAVLQSAIDLAVARGSLVVAAAGNAREDGSPSIVPADLAHVLTVGAVDEEGGLASFSNASAHMDLAAPGTGIPVAMPLSIVPSGYDIRSGTSYAAAVVSAAAAWVWTARPNLRVSQLFEVLRRSARDAGAPGWDADSGFGVLDLPAALAAPAPPPDPLEPNDDISDTVSFTEDGRSARPLTTPGRRRGVIAARVDAAEDPNDVYRVWVPPGATATVELEADANATLRLWNKGTRSITVSRSEFRGVLLGASATRGTGEQRIVFRNRQGAGKFVYAHVALQEGVARASYLLSAATG